MNDLENILKIEASPRHDTSITRGLTAKVIDHLRGITAVKVSERDVSEGLPFVDSDWITANFTPADQRSPEQSLKLRLSDQLIDEVKSADTLIIGTPIYNFGVPATLKAWIDQIARAGVTFRYTENGPLGLLQDKRAIIVIASGGTKVDSDIDFATPYLRQALGFIGIKDVTVIAADALAEDSIEKIKEAEAKIIQLQVA